MDNEILREAVKIGCEKKLISRHPLPGLEDMDLRAIVRAASRALKCHGEDHED